MSKRKKKYRESKIQTYSTKVGRLHPSLSRGQKKNLNEAKQGDPLNNFAD
jgi:hypothetical protein